MKDFFDQFDWCYFLWISVIVIFGGALLLLIGSEFKFFLELLGLILGIGAISLLIYVLVWVFKEKRNA